MLKLAVMFSLLLNIALAGMADAFEGGTVGKGGEIVAVTFIGFAQQALQVLEQPEVHREFPEIDLKKFAAAIEQTKVESREHLEIGGVTKDAITYPDEGRILVSRERWPVILTYRDQDRLALVLHEYLHILRINDENYQVSSRFQRLPSSSVLGGVFQPLPDVEPKTAYLKLFDRNGRPKTNYSAAVKKRFGTKLNSGKSQDDQSPTEREKWVRIYHELVKPVDRSIEVPKFLLAMDSEAAARASEDFELTGTISPSGAWSIALQTSLRHSSPSHEVINITCAEFVSELIREAYQRAGYSIREDFNSKRGNILRWDRTASVLELSLALLKAGWIPWDIQDFRPPVGAILFHADGRTPGHVFVSAGASGRWVIEATLPKGRDLGQTKAKTIELMFTSGVFFLPPGINPLPW